MKAFTASLGNVVSRHVVAVDRRTRRRVMRHGTEDAREIHDPSRVAFAQQRQERLGGGDEAKNIRFKCLPPNVERLGTGRFVRIMEHHSGVVDEDVEPPMLVLDRSHGLLDAVAAVHVDDDAVRIDALLAQLFRGSFGLLLVTCTDENSDPFFAELTCGFQPDAFVGAGD